MRQQHLHGRIGRCAGQRGLRIAAVLAVEMTAAVVGHAGQHQPRAAVLDHHMLVVQDADAQARQFRQPGIDTGVILVIAGDEEAAVARLQASQRGHVPAQFGHAAVDQVAGDRHQVGLEVIDGLDDAFDVALADGGSDVEVADLDDGEAVQRRGQVRERNGNRDDAGPAPRIGKAQHSHHQPEHRHGFGRRAAHIGQRQDPGHQQAGQPQREQQTVAQQREHEQRRKQPQERQTDPGQGVGPGRPRQPPRQQPGRHQDGRREQQQGEQRAGEALGKRRDDAGADVKVQRNGKREQGGNGHGRRKCRAAR